MSGALSPAFSSPCVGSRSNLLLGSEAVARAARPPSACIGDAQGGLRAPSHLVAAPLFAAFGLARLGALWGTRRSSRCRGRSGRGGRVRCHAVAGAAPVEDAVEVRRRLFQARDLWSTDLHVAIRCGEGEPKFRLGYMPMRNRCEVPRLILEEAQCTYDFEVIGFKNWKAGLKAQMPLGKVPVLYDFDGAGGVLAQEQAITRFLAAEVGLDGENATARAKLDMMYQQYWCTIRNNGLTHEGEHYSATAIAGLAARPEGPSYQEMPRVNDFTVAQRSLAALGVFEAWLAESGTGFLAGTPSPTYVDLALFEILFELSEPEHAPDFAERLGLPRLGAFLEAMALRPQLQRYLQSPGRMPRYTRPGYVYCSGRLAPASAAA